MSKEEVYIALRKISHELDDMLEDLDDDQKHKPWTSWVSNARDFLVHARSSLKRYMKES